MLELFAREPWLVVIVAAAAVIVGCTAIVFITDYLRRTHQAELDAALKRELVARGMSAGEVKQILEATSDAEAVRLALAQQGGIRLGLGKFNVECGSFSDQAKNRA